MVRDKKFYKTLLIVAVPAAVKGLITFLSNMLDSMMIGNIGGEIGNLSHAALGQASQITVLLTFLVNGIIGGSAVMISQYWGKGDVDRIKTIFSTIIRFTVGVIIAVSAVIIIFPQAAVSVFTNDKELIGLGGEYIRILAFSFAFAAITDVMIAMYRAMEKVAISFILPAITLCLDFILNNIMIFGNETLGVEAMGIRGAAISTVIARIIEIAILFGYVFFIDKKLNFKICDFLRREKRMTKDFIKYGFPIIVSDMQWGFVGAIRNGMIGRMPIVMINAYRITDIFIQASMIFSMGLAGGACVVIGKSVGEKKYDKTRQYSKTIQILFCILSVTMASTLLATHKIFPSLYDMPADVIKTAEKFLFVGALTLFGTMYHVGCFVGINRGSGDGKFVMKVDMICGWLVVLPSVYLAYFVFKLPLHFVFLATRIDQTFKWLIAFIRLRGNRWIKNITTD